MGKEFCQTRSTAHSDPGPETGEGDPISCPSPYHTLPQGKCGDPEKRLSWAPSRWGAGQPVRGERAKGSAEGWGSSREQTRVWLDFYISSSPQQLSPGRNWSGIPGCKKRDCALVTWPTLAQAGAGWTARPPGLPASSRHEGQVIPL